MLLPTATLALFLVASPAPTQEVQRLTLQPGDYRYMPLPVRATPAEISCQFHVLSGGPTVHAELLLHRDLRLFVSGKEHKRIAGTADSSAAGFLRLIEDPGEYEILIANANNGPEVTVALHIAINHEPDAAVYTRELSPRRRLTVILISFIVFFVIVTFSGIRLTRALKQTD